MKKKAMALVLALVMILSLLPVTAMADGDTVTVTLDKTNYTGGYLVLEAFDNAGSTLGTITGNGGTISVPKDGRVRVAAIGDFTVAAEGATVGEMQLSELNYYDITGFTKDTTVVINPVAVPSAPAGSVDAGNGMAYQYKDDGFSLWGVYDGEWKTTSYKDRSYKSFLTASGSAAADFAKDSEGNLASVSGNVTGEIEITPITGLQLLKISYTVTNTGSNPETYAMGTAADIKTGSDDCAVITPFTDKVGFKMVEYLYSSGTDGAQFNFYGNDVTSFWYGPYSQNGVYFSPSNAFSYANYAKDFGWAGCYEDNEAAAVFNSKAEQSFGKADLLAAVPNAQDIYIDSAASWRWEGALAAGQSKTHFVYIGVGAPGSDELTELYTVTFDANGHGTSPAAQSVAPGETASAPTDPAEDRYIFEGWYTDANCTVAFDFNTAIAADTTLYAKWAKACHEMTKTEANGATCTADGNVEYYTCSVCGKFFADEEGKNELAADKLVVKSEGHKMTKIAADGATCTADGNIEYYTCSVCGKFFADEEGTTELDADKLVVKSEGHKMTKTAADGATCTADGNIEYYTCSVCGKFFADEEGKNELAADKLVVKSEGHKMTKTEANGATCTADGNIEYFTCSVCEKIFADEKGEKELKDEELVVKSAGHKMTKTAAKAATCTADGNIEYYTCSVCEKTFADKAGKKELKAEELVVKSTGHDVKEIAAKAPTYTADGNKAFNYCYTCNTALAADGKTALTESQIKDLVIPQLILVDTDTAEVSEGAVDKALSETKKDEDVTLDLTHKDVVGAENVDAVAKAELPVAALEAVSKEGKALTLVKEDATVTLDAKALEAVAEQAQGNTVTLVVKDVDVDTLQPAQQAAVANKEVALTISAELICDQTGKKIATKDAKGFGDGAVTVAVPVPAKLPVGVKVSDLKVYYVADDGTVEQLTSKVEDGMIVFTLKHFSEYVIAADAPATSPATGDNSNMAMYFMLAAISAAAVVLLIVSEKKSKARYF